MQFTTLALAALSASAAIAADVAVHVVKVSGTTNSLTYTPNNLTAKVGDMVQFQFGVGNHTVTQSTFDAPCIPISEKSNVTGIYSGFMPVSAGATSVPTYTILVNQSTPLWFYCSQGKHCQNGMVMVINENTTKNATRSLANYAASAKTATQNLAPGGSATNGTSGTGPAGSGSPTTDGAASTSSGAPRVTNNPSAGVMNSPSMAGLMVAIAAFLI